MSICEVQDILKSLQDVLKIKQMKHFALVVRTATSKRCQKMSLLRNSDLLHEVPCNLDMSVTSLSSASFNPSVTAHRNVARNTWSSPD